MRRKLIPLILAFMFVFGSVGLAHSDLPANPSEERDRGLTEITLPVDPPPFEDDDEAPWGRRRVK